VDRRLISSASPYEPTIGFSRAVRVGAHVYVSATAAIMPAGGEPPVEAYGQMRRCLEIVLAALADAGARPEHVVRTRIYLTRAEDWVDVGRAHGEVFSTIRPATGVIVVSGFIDPRWLVELEADAIVSD
jgi:enamine deaminase RidA (YjgF/YER057c/UK114 family)